MIARGFHILPSPVTYRLLPMVVLLLGWTSNSGADVIAIDAWRVVSAVEVGYQPTNPTLFGQTFKIPTGARTLNHFDFRMHLGFFVDFPERTIPFRLRGYVARWDAASGSMAGPPLYTSNPRLVSKPHPIFDDTLPDPPEFDARSFELLSFNTGPLGVRGSEEYIAFVTALGLTDPDSRAGFGLGDMALSFCGVEGCSGPGVDYPDGAFVFGEVRGPLPTDVVFARSDGLIDTAFRATFQSAAPVPEPGTILLLSAAGIAGSAQRRRLRT
jgi:hypothetical protein